MIGKRAQWSAEAESEAQKEGAKGVIRPAGNSGSRSRLEVMAENV